VSVRGCVLAGIEGTHASGKTTLVHALTAHYRDAIARGSLPPTSTAPNA
jgi:uridine kinase